MFNTTTLGFALVGSHPHPKIKASTACACSLYSEGMGLSCSLAYNGTADFLCTNFVCFKEKSSALSSLALEPTKKLCFRGFSSSSQNKSEHGLRLLALFRGDGIRTHGGIAPTQPFQDCTLNRSDTPLSIFNDFSFSCSICAF